MTPTQILERIIETIDYTIDRKDATYSIVTQRGTEFNDIKLHAEYGESEISYTELLLVRVSPTEALDSNFIAEIQTAKLKTETALVNEIHSEYIKCWHLLIAASIEQGAILDYDKCPIDITRSK